MRFHQAFARHFVLTVGDHNLIGLQPAGNRCLVVLCERNCDLPHFYLLVRLHGKYIGSLFAALHRRGGDDQGVFDEPQAEMNIYELVWPQRTVIVRENRFQLAGSSRLVDLVVDGQKGSGSDFGLIVAAVSIDLQSSFTHMLRHGGEAVLGERKQDGNRLKFGNDQQWLGVIGVHHVAGVTRRSPIRPLSGAVMWQ